MQLCTGVPSTWTVQAPQSPPSQPFLTPRLPCSRRKVRRHWPGRGSACAGDAVDLDGHAQAPSCWAAPGRMPAPGSAGRGGQKSPDTCAVPVALRGPQFGPDFLGQPVGHVPAPGRQSVDVVVVERLRDGGVQRAAEARRPSGSAPEAQLHGPLGRGGDGQHQGCRRRRAFRSAAPPDRPRLLSDRRRNATREARADAGRWMLRSSSPGARQFVPSPVTNRSPARCGWRRRGPGWWPRRRAPRRARSWARRAATCRGCRPRWTCSRP